MELKTPLNSGKTNFKNGWLNHINNYPISQREKEEVEACRKFIRLYLTHANQFLVVGHMVIKSLFVKAMRAGKEKAAKTACDGRTLDGFVQKNAKKKIDTKLEKSMKTHPTY